MNEWILQISSGTGPEEVRRFVALLAHQMHLMCEALGLPVISLSFHGPEPAPVSASLLIQGPAPERLQQQLGTHVLVHSFGGRGRASRKRWFAGLSLSPKAKGCSLSIPAKDLQITTSKAGGPGGQHVNTTDSAVRILHKPTGLSVRATSERSQHQNRRQALARLRSLLAERQVESQSQSRTQQRQQHYHFERGSAVQVWRLDQGTLRKTQS